jgi:hypothetical protein
MFQVWPVPKALVRRAMLSWVAVPPEAACWT